MSNLNDQVFQLTYRGPMPEGWEPTGEVRPARCGETYLNEAYAIQAVNREGCIWPVIILRRARWVPEDGEEFEYVTLQAGVSRDRYVSGFQLYVQQAYAGNCYKPGTGEAAAAAVRVRKAYRGDA